MPDVKLGKPVDHDAVINAEIQKAADLMQTRQPAEARKVYQSLLEKYPQAQPAFKAQVHGAVAQTYMAENQAPQAIEQLKKATETDPSNVDLQLAYGEILMQANQRAEGEKVLLSLDLSQGEGSVPVHEHHHRQDQRSEG